MLFFLLLLLPMTALAAGSAEKDYGKAKEAYERLLASPGKQKMRENWTRVIDGFVSVASRHGDSPEGGSALFMAGRAGEGLFKRSRKPGDAKEALARLEEMVRRYPDDRLADDALLLAGALHEKLENPAEAWRCYQNAVKKYPDGDKSSQARKGMTRLARYAPKADGSGAAPEAPKVENTSGGKISRVKLDPSAADEELTLPSHKTSAASAPSSGPAQLTGIRFWSNPGYTRVVLDLSAPIKFTSNFLKGGGKGNPSRLYVDLAETVPASGLAESTDVGDGLLRQIRAGRPNARTVRVVLDLMSFKNYKVFPLEDPMRIILDIQGEAKAQTASLAPELKTPPANPADTIEKALTTLPDSKPIVRKAPPIGGNALRRVVVDAGHGGKDPGAIGPTGVREKDVTLSMARIVAKRLREEIGCEVILTRDSDIFIPLEERTAIANRVGADLFISIHANAAPNKEAYGIETYYLNFSKNNKAAAVAARENGTSLKQVGDLELILFDLMANSKINESSRLAAEIQRSLVDDLGKHYSFVKDLGVRQGPFYVLLGATMPSVLVETAFISHPREETRLAETAYHEKSAAAIVRAVRSYATAQKMIATR